MPPAARRATGAAPRRAAREPRTRRQARARRHGAGLPPVIHHVRLIEHRRQRLGRESVNASVAGKCGGRRGGRAPVFEFPPPGDAALQNMDVPPSPSGSARRRRGWRGLHRRRPARGGRAVRRPISSVASHQLPARRCSAVAPADDRLRIPRIAHVEQEQREPLRFPPPLPRPYRDRSERTPARSASARARFSAAARAAADSSGKPPAGAAIEVQSGERPQPMVPLRSANTGLGIPALIARLGCR